MRSTLRLASPLLAIVLLAPHASFAASDSDIAALKEQIAILSQKVEQLQANAAKAKPAKAAHGKKTAVASEDVTIESPKVVDVPAASVPSKHAAAPAAAAPAPAPLVAGENFPGSIKLPGTDTAIKIGGYVKLDAIADVGTGYGSPYAKFYALPLENTSTAQQSEQTTFTAQQSRLNFETRTATKMGELKTFVEADFYGSAAANGNTNGYGLELRHAYGSLGHVLAGQTWSNFMDTTAMPESLDYVGPAGSVFVRQAQVRYTDTIGAVTLSASVEAPLGNQSLNTQNAITYVGTTNSAHGQMPDLVARADYKYTGNGYVSLRALANELNVDHTTGTNNNTVSKYGYGVAVSGKQGLLGKDSVMYDVVYGDGTGRYILDVGAAGNYYNSTTNELDKQAFLAAKLGYQHVWSDQFRTNIFGGFVRNYNDTSFTGGTANKDVASGHINLIWQPLPSYKVGVEYMHGYRKIESGVDGNLDRIETSFSYGF